MPVGNHTPAPPPQRAVTAFKRVQSMRRDSEPSSSDFDDDWSSCSTCSSDRESMRAARMEHHKSTVAAHALFAKRARKAKKRVQAVKTAIASVLAAERSSPKPRAQEHTTPQAQLGDASQSPESLRAPTTALSPDAVPAAPSSTDDRASTAFIAATSRVSDALSSDAAGASGDAAAVPVGPAAATGNATPPPTHGSFPRRGSFARRSSLRSTASAATSFSGDTDSDGDGAATDGDRADDEREDGSGVGDEPWKPSAEEERRIVVAMILKKGVKTKEAMEMEHATKTLKTRRDPVKLADLGTAQAVLKSYMQGSIGKSVTYFGAAAFCVLFIVRMKRKATGQTQHETNQQRLQHIQETQSKKNDTLSRQIHGATVRSMHLHITKQRDGLSSLVTAAVKQSTARSRKARVGKDTSSRVPLMQHTEDTLFDRSEFKRGASRGDLRVATSAAGSDSNAWASGTFDSGAWGAAGNQFSELSQFLFDGQPAAAPPSLAAAAAAGGGSNAPRGPQSSAGADAVGGAGSDAAFPASAEGARPAPPTAGESRPGTFASNVSSPQSRVPGSAAADGTVLSSRSGQSFRRTPAVTAAAAVHRPLDIPVVDKHIFVMHYRWRDEPFRDPFVETDAVYQYGNQQESSALFAFTRTAMPNLHLEVHRLREQLDPEPWDGTKEDLNLRYAKRAMDDKYAAATERRKAVQEGTQRRLSAEARQRMAGRKKAQPLTSRGGRRPQHASDSREAGSGGGAQTARHELPSLPDLPSAHTSRVGTATTSFASSRDGQRSRGASRGGASSSVTAGHARQHDSFRGWDGDDSALDADRTAQVSFAPSAHDGEAGDSRTASRRAGGGGRPMLQMDELGGSAIMQAKSMIRRNTALRPPSEPTKRDVVTKGRHAALDEAARAQRRQELELLQNVMEEEHRVAIDTFHRFFLHKEMEHSVFASKSIDEVRRLIESNELIFPMKRREILRAHEAGGGGGAASSGRRGVQGRALPKLDRKTELKVDAVRGAGPAAYDAFRELKGAEGMVKDQVKRHQLQRSIEYTQQWFRRMVSSVEAHMGGLTEEVAEVFTQFRPTFEGRITGPAPFTDALKGMEEHTLLRGDVQFVLHRLAVPFGVRAKDIRATLDERGIPYLLLDGKFYKEQRQRADLTEAARKREENLRNIDSHMEVNTKLDEAMERGLQLADEAGASVILPPPASRGVPRTTSTGVSRGADAARRQPAAPAGRPTGPTGGGVRLPVL